MPEQQVPDESNLQNRSAYISEVHVHLFIYKIRCPTVVNWRLREMWVELSDKQLVSESCEQRMGDLGNMGHMVHYGYIF